MKLIKFRIRNYKSIRDSGYCWLASDLTVLAGKNESGKSAVLEALRDFDPSTSIPYVAHPIDRDEPPLLECHFTFDELELNELFEGYSDALRNGLSKTFSRDGVTLFRDKEGQYSFDETVSETIERIDREESERAVAAEKERAARLAEEATRRAAAEAAGEEEQSEAAQAEEEADEEEEVQGDGEQEAAADSQEQEERKPLLEAVVEKLPRFVFFSSFEDVLPFQTTFRAARTKRSVQDFAKVAGLDLAKISKIEDVQDDATS